MLDIFVLFLLKVKTKILKRLNVQTNMVEFESELLNGELYGKIKKYYYNGVLKFEGECINGKNWNGKGYDIKNKISYELKNGAGFVKEYNYRSQLLF